ncbi:hypothetical protein SPB21_08525 [Leptothoe sp. ISB3NOV94-8A]
MMDDPTDGGRPHRWWATPLMAGAPTVFKVTISQQEQVWLVSIYPNLM